MSIHVGSAWTEPALIKCRRFYPPGCSSAEARPRSCASHFREDQGQRNARTPTGFPGDAAVRTT